MTKNNIEILKNRAKELMHGEAEFIDSIQVVLSSDKDCVICAVCKNHFCTSISCAQAIDGVWYCPSCKQ